MMDMPPLGRRDEAVPRERMEDYLDRCSDNDLREIAANPVSEVAMNALQATGGWDYVRAESLTQHHLLISRLEFLPEYTGLNKGRAASLVNNEGYFNYIEPAIPDQLAIQDIAQQILDTREGQGK